MLQLRDYQETVLADLMTWFAENPEGEPLVNACVGAGKSVMISEFVRRTVTQWPGQRIVMLAPTRELVRQNYEKIMSLWPEAPVGIHCAGLGRKDMEQPIIFATIGSIHKRAFDMPPFSLGLVDESHNIPSKEAGLYRKYIKAQKSVNPYFRLVGWTGTVFRGNGIWLWEGENPIFTDVAAQVTMKDLLKRGYLSPLVVAETTVKTDTSDVKMSGGDFVLSQLAKVVDVPEKVEAACDELIKLGQDRKSWLVYGATVEHAEHINQALQARGIKSAVISQHTSDRDGIIADYKSGKLRALVNVAVLSVGFDAPATDLIALMRPTRSPVLYVQIAGRGMRLADGKTDCLWCDFSDSTAILGPVDSIQGRSYRGSKGGDAPKKPCPDCGHICAAGVRVCPNCAHEFPFDAAHDRHGRTASTAAVLTTEIKPQEVEVTKVFYQSHSKPGKRTSLMVVYQCGLKQHREWICFEHTGYARDKARTWWRERFAGIVIPETTGEALELIKEIGLREPTHITVKANGKYTDITRFRFDQAASGPTPGSVREDKPSTWSSPLSALQSFSTG